jgi:DNA-binding response OmpR family regulator
VSGPVVLLLGAEAEALAPRLALSGYDPHCGGDHHGAVQAVVLAPGQEGGIPLLRRRYGAVPVLLGVGSDTLEGREHCLASGADDFWLSDHGPSDLLMRLRLQLSHRPPPPIPAAPLVLADLVLMPERQAARRGGRLLDLTGRETELLQLLLRHQGEVVSRETILREIWPERGEGASNVIEVYVRYLRRKLEAGGERRLLHTVRGRGYCLAEAPPRPGDPDPSR